MNRIKKILAKAITGFFRHLFLPILAVISAILVSSVIIFFAGYSPIVTFSALYEGAFGSFYNISETVLRSIPYMLTGLGVCLSFRAKMFNIGAEGQFYMGALVASYLGVSLAGLPSILLIPIIIVASFAAGGAYGAFPGYLKAKVGASEIVTTVMLNTIALQIVSFMVTGPLQEPKGFFPETQEIVAQAKLPVILSGTRLHVGIVIAVILVIVMQIFLFKTVSGYQLRAVGSNREAARYGGISINRNIVKAMLISGGIAGIAGGIELLGVTWKLYQRLSPGYGYTAIAVALLAKKNPIGVLISGLLFGALTTGANMMQRSVGIPTVLVNVLQALIIFFIVGYSIYEERLLKVLKGMSEMKKLSKVACVLTEKFNTKGDA